MARLDNYWTTKSLAVFFLHNNCRRQQQQQQLDEFIYYWIKVYSRKIYFNYPPACRLLLFLNWSCKGSKGVSRVTKETGNLLNSHHHRPSVCVCVCCAPDIVINKSRAFVWPRVKLIGDKRCVYIFIPTRDVCSVLLLLLWQVTICPQKRPFILPHSEKQFYIVIMQNSFAFD